MATTLIIGDGPAGLSAALFLAKRCEHVTVFGQDQTPMHHAQLSNYLGIPNISGSDFQATAREQAAALGAELRDAEVTAISTNDDDGVVVQTTVGEARGGLPRPRRREAVDRCPDRNRHGSTQGGWAAIYPRA